MKNTDQYSVYRIEREGEREIERDIDVTNVFMQILTIYLCKIQKHEVFVQTIPGSSSYAKSYSSFHT